MNKNGLYAFYGTLREGMENHALYADGMKRLRTVKLYGFTLHSLIDYPYAVRSADQAHVMTVELFEVRDILTAEAIHKLEIDAGYYYEEIEVDNMMYGIYLYQQANRTDEVIAHGDWVVYVSK